MPSVNLNQTEYYGTVSTPPSGREAGPRECRHCGSSLATRYQGVRLIGERPRGSGSAAANTNAGSPWRPPLHRSPRCELARLARWPGFDARRAPEQYMCEGRLGSLGRSPPAPVQSTCHRREGGKVGRHKQGHG